MTSSSVNGSRKPFACRGWRLRDPCRSRRTRSSPASAEQSERKKATSVHCPALLAKGQISSSQKRDDTAAREKPRWRREARTRRHRSSRRAGRSAIARAQAAGQFIAMEPGPSTGLPPALGGGSWPAPISRGGGHASSVASALGSSDAASGIGGVQAHQHVDIDGISDIAVVGGIRTLPICHLPARFLLRGFVLPNGDGWLVCQRPSPTPTPRNEYTTPAQLHAARTRTTGC